MKFNQLIASLQYWNLYRPDVVPMYADPNCLLLSYKTGQANVTGLLVWTGKVWDFTEIYRF